MQFEDFKIDTHFWTDQGEWVVSDVATMHILAIHEEDFGVKIGVAPYSVSQQIFDAYDFGGCFPSKETWEADRREAKETEFNA